MDFSSAIRTCFSKYATFTGRAMRSEFWFFQLFLLVLNAVVNLVDSSSAFSAIFGLATFLPALAVGARRLHDTDKSGWWQLLYPFPVIGLIVLIIFFVQPGASGANRFGDDPLTAPAL